MTQATQRFRLIPDRLSANDLEQELLDRWAGERLFEESQRLRESGPPFIFYDGPPTANGRPGIHHVFARTFKDLFCRHRAMLGFHVPRKAGWDTHGLPVEIEVEKALGISGKREIEALGVERFNQLCRESVWKYRAEWEQLCRRIAHWLDYENPYITYSNDYIESEWWALRTLHDRGLLYRGHKILPYCPRCGTALSSHEVAQGYQDVSDPSVFVALDLVDDGPTRRRLVVWTTTPWTLVSNVALAVNPSINYVELRKRKGGSDWTIILGESRVASVLGADYADRWDVAARFSGDALAGRRYRRPLEWVPFEGEAEHEIIVAADFVSADDGSGIVHMAPAFGVDDYATGRRHGLAMLQPVEADGRFSAGIPVVGGIWVKEADALIIEELRRRDLLWKSGELIHPYPHCWRCGTPLLYYARGSWFVKTTAFREEMTARNEATQWYPPEVGSGRFGDWLENNVDWALSRDRYWGTPLPVWECSVNPSHVEVIGSYAELAERTGADLSSGFDPHKPFVDQWTWKCRMCPDEAVMRRVPEVIDAWFDSGSMPFAQWHFPFENRELTAREYPADFIAEGLDQTRGWFYSLLAIATGLGDALPDNIKQAGPYRNVVVNDLLLDANGVKMAKSRGNVVDPFAVVERHGADAVRLFLVATSQLGMPKRFDENLIREVATGFLVTLRNVYSGMFAQYANYGWEPGDHDPPLTERAVLDRWIISRLAAVEEAVNGHLLAFDAFSAARELMSFVTDDVSNWYVRQTRGRLYEVTGPDNRAAFATLHQVLTVSARLLAPFAPFLSDWLHRELTGTSVHLSPFVRTGTEDRNQGLERGMAEIRELARLGRAAREDAGINVRRPLAAAFAVVPAAFVGDVEPLLGILGAELNVKSLRLLSSADALVRLEGRPNFKSLGRRFGKQTQEAARAVQALTPDDLLAFEGGAAVTFSVAGQSHTLDAGDVTINRVATGEMVVREAAGRFCAIDPVVTEALRSEGLARELVSRIQRLRKELELSVSDRILIRVWGDPEIQSAADEYIDWISGEVLARSLAVGQAREPEVSVTHKLEIDGLQVNVTIEMDN
ncbi:MAG: isoleucine--tRNA ligase [Gemmatimonadota bacterium]